MWGDMGRCREIWGVAVLLDRILTHLQLHPHHLGRRRSSREVAQLQRAMVEVGLSVVRHINAHPEREHLDRVRVRVRVRVHTQP